MTKLGFTVVAVLAGIVSLVSAVGASASPAAPKAPKAVGHVFVNDNTTGVNTVAGFNRNRDGSLTPIPGSPFSAGGAGAGHADTSQGSLQLRTPTAATCSRSTPAATRSRCSGSSPTGHSRSPHGRRRPDGVNPVSIAVHGNLVYVANAGPPPATRTTPASRSTHGGHLRPIAGSTVALPDRLAARRRPLQRRRHEARRHPRRTRSLIDSFTVGHDGRLTAAPGSPFEHQAGRASASSAASSARRSRRSCSSRTRTTRPTGGAPGRVSAFTRRGRRHPDPDRQRLRSPTTATASCWIEISHDGKYLFAVNTALGDRRQLLDRRRRHADR